MKTKSAYLLMLIVFLFSSCVKDNKEEPLPDLPSISVIDISGESEWDYCIVGKQDYYYIKAENTIPQAVLFHSSEANKDYTILFTSNGMLDKVVVDGNIFIFNNFNGNKVDIGIINSNGDINILREIETSFNWDNLKNSNNVEAWSDVIRWSARVASGVPCALSVATAVGSGGIATPIALWTCGNFLLSLSVDVATNDFDVHNGFTDFVDTYGAFSTGMACTTADVLSCATGAASSALHEWANAKTLIENRAEAVQSTTASLQAGYGDIQVTLTWNNEADLDLHVIDPNNEEIYWNHPYSSSGGVLDYDDVNGYGPENIYWPQGEAPVGNYSVYVHHYPSSPSSSNYTVLINIAGQITQFSGSTSNDQTNHIANFNLNGISSIVNFKSHCISKFEHK